MSAPNEINGDRFSSTEVQKGEQAVTELDLTTIVPMSSHKKQNVLNFLAVRQLFRKLET